ncbi:hypothetical protein Tco_0612928 [Tanacetum coccineum]
MWIPMSERLLNKLGDDIMFNPQPDCQYNPITGEVIKESDKVSAVKEKPIDVTEKSNVVKESDKAPSLDVFKYKRKTELPKDNQKDNPKDKESDKAPVVAAVVSDESDKTTVAAPILKEKTADVIEKSIVVKESDKAPIVKESDKVPVVKESDKAMVFGHVLKEKPVDVIEKSTVVNEKEKSAVDVMSKVPKDKEKPTVDVMSKVGKSKAIVHNDKALDVVSKDKPKGNPPPVVGKGNATSVIGKAKNKPSVLKGKVPTELPKKKHKADIPKDKPKPKDKHKVDLEVPEDRSKKKLELRMIKGKMVSDEVDSNEVTPSKIHDILGISVGGISLFSLDVRPIKHEFVRSWVDQFYPKLLKEIRVGDIASKVISAQQVDFLFKVNFLTLFAGLRGQIFLYMFRRLREESVISKIDWCGYIHSCLEDSEVPEKPTVQYLGPFTFLTLLYLDSTKFDRFPIVRTRPTIKDWTSTLMRKRQDLETKEHVIGCLDLHNEWTESELQETEGFTRALFKKAEEKLASICSERVVLQDLMRKASLDYPGDQKFVELQEKYVQVFRDPISFDVDVNSIDGGNDSDGDDDGNGNNDEELNVDNDDGNGNNDEELNDEDTLGRNPSFGFSKIGLDDFEKQPSQEGTDVGKNRSILLKKEPLLNQIQLKKSDKASVVAPVLKENPADVIEKSTIVNKKEKPVVDVTSKVAKDKENPSIDVTSKVGVHKDKALDVVSKDKPKGNPPSIVGKGNAPSLVGKSKYKPFVVKGKVPTELPKKKDKADIPKDKPKPKDKHKVDSEVPVLRSKPEVKAKASVSEDVKRKRMLSKEDHSKKKLELKMIKGNGP